MALLDAGPRSADVVARERATLVEFRRQVLAQRALPRACPICPFFGHSSGGRLENWRIGWLEGWEERPDDAPWLPNSGPGRDFGVV